MTQPNAVNTFVPADLDCADFAQLQPLYQALLDQPIESTGDLEAWLADYSELVAHVSEYGSRRNIEYSCHTDDAQIEKAYLHFVENISPKIKPLGFALAQKCLDCGHADKLGSARYGVLVRDWKAEVELYRDDNVPLQTQVTKTYTQYDKLCGQMLVTFRGTEYTLQQLARFIEDPDRDTRREAWEISTNRRLQDRAAMDTIFDQLLGLRADIAANAGKANYRDYVWQEHCRFDYLPQDCYAFADAIEKACLPVVKRLNDHRRAALGVDALRPWDMAVDVHGRAALAPFPADDVDKMVAGVGEVFERINPQLAEQYHQLKPGRNLDLQSRKGKRPGGYQSSLEVAREPFIFMNAAGLHRDVETMLHEAGHAFHYMACRDEPLVFLRHAPLEFCEVASMSQELLAMDHMDVFYDEQDAARAKRAQLEGIIRLLPWIATIDQFQHRLYGDGVGRDAASRTELWLETSGRFADPRIDHSGYEDARAARWQQQIHLFHYPFYYIEYGIAQLGALQVWLNYMDQAAPALARLREAFAQGGTAGLPELFKTAGIRFDFSYETVAPLMDKVQAELERL